MSDEIERLGKAFDDASATLDAYGSAQNAANQQEQQRSKKNDELKKATADFAKGIGQFTSALISGAEGQAKYGNGVQSLANGIAGVVKQIPLVGTVLGLVIEAFGAAAKKVLEYNDALVNTNRKLGEVGQNVGLTTTEMLNLANRVGFSSKNIDKYAKVMAGMGSTMLYFGKTASDGAKSFTAMAAMTDEQRAIFTKLGSTTEDTLADMGDYAKIQGLRGKTSTSDFKALKEGTVRYATYLAEISALTGDDKKTIKARMEATANNLRLNLIRDEYEKTGRKEIADEMGKISDLGGQMGEALTEIVVTGTASNENAVNLVKQTRGAVIGWVQQFKAGKMSAEELTKRVAIASEETMKGMPSAAIIYGKVHDTMGYSVKTREENLKVMNRSTAAAQAEIDNKIGMADTLMNAEAARVNSEISAGIAYDKIIGLVAGPVNSALQKLFQAASAFADMVTSIITWIKKIPGWFSGKGNSGTNDPDFSNAATGTVGTNYSSGIDGGTEAVQNPETAKEMYNYLRNKGMAHENAVGAVATVQGISGFTDSGSWKPKLDDLLKTEQGKSYAADRYSDSASAAKSFANEVVNTDKSLISGIGRMFDGKAGAAAYKTTGLDALLKTSDNTAAPAPKKMKIGGVLNAPLSGYNVEMHGEEMVIPLGDGRSIPVTMQGAGGISGEVMALMIERLQSISDIIRQSNSTEEEVLRHARNA